MMGAYTYSIMGKDNRFVNIMGCPSIDKLNDGVKLFKQMSQVKLIESINGHLNYSDLEEDSSSIYVSWKVPYVDVERALINMGYITKQNSAHNNICTIAI